MIATLLFSRLCQRAREYRRRHRRVFSVAFVLVHLCIGFIAYWFFEHKPCEGTTSARFATLNVSDAAAVAGFERDSCDATCHSCGCARVVLKDGKTKSCEEDFSAIDAICRPARE
jgi:hypothetical protein